jgi:DNA-binding NtrC family response regulator
MLIDNDKYVRESLRVFFGDSPVDLVIFKTAAEGLDALNTHTMDVVVSDYFLPDMDGLTLLKQVKKMQPDVIRILMATISSDELEQEIQKAEINRFIEKPLTVASLDTVINELAKTNLSNQGRR